MRRYVLDANALLTLVAGRPGAKRVDRMVQEAARTGTTIRALVEEGLRQVLKSRRGAAIRFTLRKTAFRGRGLRPELREGGWAAIRDRAYEGHGS